VPYRDQPKALTHNAPHNGRSGAAYRAEVAQVRERVRRGGRAARCWFWRRPGHEACPGAIDLRLPPNHRFAFTAHHLQRLMDGGAAVVSAQFMAPAHRGCNARDGLMAQNARRAAGVRRVGARATGVGKMGRQGVRARTRTAIPPRTVGSEGVRVDRQSRAW
jgi:hypothetical protein